MEADGRSFFNADGVETDIFALMKQIGMNAIRLRVWVNPQRFGYGAWCDKADILAKAKRAHAQGLDLLIDFHYSDFFADPGTQTLPLDWTGFTREQVKAAVASHTKDVLQTLKAEGIEPRWVQVGNETNSGMIWDYGKIDWNKYGSDRFTDYAELSNVAYDAVKEVLPEAQVMILLLGAGGGRRMETIVLQHRRVGSLWYGSFHHRRQAHRGTRCLRQRFQRHYIGRR